MTENRIYTEAQATDEALRMFVRRMRRLHSEQYASVVTSLPDGLRAALDAAEMRADTLMLTRPADVTYIWPADVESDESDDQE